MTSSSSQAPLRPLANLQADAIAMPGNFRLHMELGAALHSAGQPERALVAFEKALALAPRDSEAASACATLMFELDRPHAAYACLATVRDQLLLTADGVCNLAVAAEACGEHDEARACYQHALALEPDHLRSLNNMALIAAREGRWEQAIANARRCVELLPGEPLLWLNLCDMLVGSRNFMAALDVLARATTSFPQLPALAIRQVVVLAFNAEFERAGAALDAMGPQGLQLLRDHLAASTHPSPDAPVGKATATAPNLRELFTQQAFEALVVCDWRYNDKLLDVIRELLAHALQTGEPRDWRDTQFYGLALPLEESELAKIRVTSTQAIADSLTGGLAPFTARRAVTPDGRMRIGLATQSLRDPRFADALARQLSLHDASRFAMYVYAPTQQPEARLLEPLLAHAAGAIEVAHMSTDEMAARIRLDRLDLFMDMAFDTPWCRPEIPQRRVAPVQIRQITWHRHNPPQPCEYNMSDTFVHPDGLDLTPYGAVVRLPYTCWLAANDDQPEAPASRVDLGIPGDALVLGTFLPAVMVDPDSFSLWMQMLRALPDAILLMPGFAPAAKANLQREAQAAGVSSERLTFMPRLTRAETLARMSLTDLLVDTVRCNANHGLVDALRMGVPALTCAGNSMASRLGGSIVRAAGLPECVYGDRGEYVDAVIRFGRNRSEIEALRSRLRAARSTAPLFDTAARVREWEAAWTTMVERHRNGLAPVAFDVPPQE
jgi:protein O-GlcNAc transferase